MGTTNGIEVSSDEKLYVHESIQRNVGQYDIDKQDNLSNKPHLFLLMTNNILDGMRCEVIGKLYITRYNKVPSLSFNPLKKS